MADVGCSCGILVTWTSVGAGASGSFGGGIELDGVCSGTDDENVVPDENWMPP